ncbi:hypothetical protein T07_4339, partial [Trichinella nelsoni]
LKFGVLVSGQFVGNVIRMFTHLNIKICEFCVLESSCFIISVQYSMLHEKPGVDKSIVLYFGHHPAMFMKGKLIRLRYKV